MSILSTNRSSPPTISKIGVKLLPNTPMYIDRPFPDWIPILRDLEKRLIAIHSDLASLGRDQISNFPKSISSPKGRLSLRQAACIDSRTARPIGMEINFGDNAHLLDQSTSRGDLGKTETGQSFGKTQHRLSTAESPDSMAPTNKISDLANPPSRLYEISLFLPDGSALALLNLCPASLRSVASGIERYAAFRDLLSKPYCPPNKETILQWETIFKETIWAHL